MNQINLISSLNCLFVYFWICEDQKRKKNSIDFFSRFQILYKLCIFVEINPSCDSLRLQVPASFLRVGCNDFGNFSFWNNKGDRDSWIWKIATPQFCLFLNESKLQRIKSKLRRLCNQHHLNEKGNTAKQERSFFVIFCLHSKRSNQNPQSTQIGDNKEEKGNYL